MSLFLRRSGLGLLALLFAIQLWPAGRTNPPVTADLEAPPEVKEILRRSCYDCHSNETRWPWYSRVAPVSWFLVHDVEEARAEMNFSKWGEYAEKKRDSKVETMLDQIREGAMPPASYLRMHSVAEVSPAEIERLTHWVEKPVQVEPR